VTQITLAQRKRDSCLLGVPILYWGFV
jgi:hypothetical protein